MIFTILVLSLAFALTTFLGYWFHRAFHQQWSGPFFRAHMNHHLKQYPPNDFISEQYRSAGADNSVVLFALAFLPILLTLAGVVVFLGLSLWTALLFSGGMVATGLLHDKLHDAFHLKKSIWQYIPFFKRWQELHLVHHEDMSKNFGIFSFTVDKLFKTFKP